MLVKPIGRRAKNTARHPIDSHDLVAKAAFIGPRAQMVGPHERIAFRTQDNEDRSAAVKMRFVIAPHRPFGQMADQGIIGNLELRKIDPRAFLFLRVDLRLCARRE